MAEKTNLRMGTDFQKGGLLKKTLGDTGLPKPSDKPTLKPVTQKGIMSKGGSLGAGGGAATSMTNGKHSLPGFGSGGKVQP